MALSLTPPPSPLLLAASQQDSPFLRLPGEIRNEIYKILLVIPPPATSQTLGERVPVYPHVLQVSRRIYHEAKPFLYQKNTFIAHPTLLVQLPQLRRWLDPVPEEYLQKQIRRHHISVRLECDARFTLKACTDAFTGAEELTVEVFRSQFRGSGNSNKVLKLFEGIRGVRKARIFGHGIEEWPEYIRLLEMSMMSLPGTNLLAEERRKGVIDDKLGNIVSVWDATGLLAMPA